MSSNETYNTIVVGGGQAGLAAGYYLTRGGDNFVILDENRRTGDSWRNRWDSLRLFTPSLNNQLPGMRFPKPDAYSPTKDEAADYLESYAKQFSLPIRHGVKIDSLDREDDGFRLTAGEDTFHAKQVIAATGTYRIPNIPAFASKLNPDFFQIHSSIYRKPADVPVHSVVVVGAGNSGAEIAMELAQAGKQVWLAGRDVGRIPAAQLVRAIGNRPYWWFMHHVMTVNTPLGRRMKAQVLAHGNPLINLRREDVAATGVELVPRLSAESNSTLRVEDSRTIPAQGVLWATGFRPDFSWINLPIFEPSGYPKHERGVSRDVPGLSFLGLHFQTGLASSLLGGVGIDAKYITSQIKMRGAS